MTKLLYTHNSHLPELTWSLTIGPMSTKFDTLAAALFLELFPAGHGTARCNTMTKHKRQALESDRTVRTNVHTHTRHD